MSRGLSFAQHCPNPRARMRWGGRDYIRCVMRMACLLLWPGVPLAPWLWLCGVCAVRTLLCAGCRLVGCVESAVRPDVVCRSEESVESL